MPNLLDFSSDSDEPSPEETCAERHARGKRVNLCSDSDADHGASPPTVAHAMASSSAADAKHVSGASSSAAALQAFVAPPVAHDAGATLAKSAPRSTAFVGRGRWGAAADRAAAAARMRECKARLGARRAEEALQVLRRQVNDAISRIRPRGGNQHSRKVSFVDLLRIGYESGCRKVSDLAAQYKVATRTVKDMIVFLASWFLHLQLLVVGAIVMKARLCRPEFTMSRLSWDETGEKINLNLLGCSAVSTWHIMVARLRLVISWGQRPYMMNIVFPPLICPNTSAAAMYYQLFQHPLTSPLMHGLEMIHACSDLPVYLVETDGFAANEKLIAHLLNSASAQTLFCSWLCFLHQVQLIEASLTSCVGLCIVSRLYSLSLLLRSSGLFARMSMRVKDILRRGLCYKVIRESGPPPDEALAFSMEFSNYLCSNFQRIDRAASQPQRHHWLGDLDSDGESDDADVCADGAAPRQGQRRSSRAMFRQKVRDMMAVCNGVLWTDGMFVHYCGGAACCPNGPESTIERMDCAVRAVLFSSVPLTPAANKWTKLGPCCDAVFGGMLLGRVYLHALVSLQIAQPEQKQGDNNADEDYIRDVDFGAVQGKRYKVSVEFLSHKENNVGLAILSLLLEPLRFLTAWLMRRAKEVYNPCCQSLVFDMWVEGLSPIVFASQYLATLLDGQNPRLMLLWRPAGFSSFHDFCLQRPPPPPAYVACGAQSW